jgi:hypothetical protein
MNDIYQIENLTEAEAVKLIYNNKNVKVEIDNKGNVINIFPSTKRFLLQDIIHRLGNSISIK